MAKARVHVTKSTTKTHTVAKVSKGKGNPNKCPVCGKFISKGGRKA